MFDKSQLQERVQRGIKFLNGTYPDWLERFNLREMHVMSGCGCPLAQAGQTCFSIVSESLKLTGLQQFDYGFNVLPNSDYYTDYMDEITGVWKEEVTKLRQEDATPTFVIGGNQ